MSKITRPTREDDAALCVDPLRPKLQSIIDHGFAGDALVWAMDMTFAELLRARGSSEDRSIRALAALTQLPPQLRNEARECHRRIRAVTAEMRQEGFSLDALLWSVLGAMTNIYQQMDVPKQKINAARHDMIIHINNARHVSLNE